MEILPSTLFVMLGIGVISVFTMPEIGILSRVIGAFCVSVPLLLICMFIDGAFGGGDIKLMFVVGIVLGWKLTVCVIGAAVRIRCCACPGRASVSGVCVCGRVVRCGCVAVVPIVVIAAAGCECTAQEDENKADR